MNIIIENIKISILFVQLVFNLACVILDLYILFSSIHLTVGLATNTQNSINRYIKNGIKVLKLVINLTSYIYSCYGTIKDPWY